MLYTCICNAELWEITMVRSRKLPQFCIQRYIQCTNTNLWELYSNLWEPYVNLWEIYTKLWKLEVILLPKN